MAEVIRRAVKLTENELIMATRARADMIRRRRAAMMADERAKRWARLTATERAQKVIELMTKNHMAHAKLLGKHQSEEALREKLIQCAMRHDILDRKEMR